MGKINVLGFDVANLIAAGEVVDRPSSVVKELIENSIDSGATKITVEIKNGGTSFIRIADNGCGMEFEDLPIAILRHATSKIKDASDLNEIMTLGFRGEALAAISSVSKVRILSRPQKNEMGALLEAHGGEIINHIKSGCAEGTTVIVEDIFYNVPARKKFLKPDRSETASVSAVMEKISLSRPDISFKYIVDGGVKYITSGDGNLQNTVYAVLGRDVAKKTIKVERDDNGVRVEGFISTPEFVSSYRTQENFYINSRYVKSKTAQVALEQAYASYIPNGKFPFCVLNIIIAPSTVDVNVHPAKLEVKFSNEKIIFDTVYYAVRTALTKSIERPTLYAEEKTEKTGKELLQTPFPVRDREISIPKNERIVFDSNSNFGKLKSNNTLDYTDIKQATPKTETTRKIDSNKFEKYVSEEAFSLNLPKEPRREVTDEEIKLEMPKTVGSVLPLNSGFAFNTEYGGKTVSTDTVTTEIKETTPKEQTLTELKTETHVEPKIVPDYKIIGEAFNSYVIVELGDIMYLIDKHAAHERIIFEDLKAKIKSATPSSQMLLFPLEIKLSSEELSTLYEWESEVSKMGFGYSVVDNGVSIYEIPSEIEPAQAEESFATLISKLCTNVGYAEISRYDFFEKALYQASCKSAIKAGRVYDKEHIKWICDRVLTLDNIKYCPHGRPVAFEITKHFLEKQFERIK